MTFSPTMAEKKVGKSFNGNMASWREKSFNIQLLKYNIEFNKQEELTIVPSVGQNYYFIIPSDFSSPAYCCLMRNWYFLSGAVCFLLRAPIYTMRTFFLHFPHPWQPRIWNEIIEKSWKMISIWWFRSSWAADSAWRTIAIRNKLNVNRETRWHFYGNDIKFGASTG